MLTDEFALPQRGPNLKGYFRNSPGFQALSLTSGSQRIQKALVGPPTEVTHIALCVMCLCAYYALMMCFGLPCWLLLLYFYHNYCIWPKLELFRISTFRPPGKREPERQCGYKIETDFAVYLFDLRMRRKCEIQRISRIWDRKGEGELYCSVTALGLVSTREKETTQKRDSECGQRSQTAGFKCSLYGRLPL